VDWSKAVDRQEPYHDLWPQGRRHLPSPAEQPVHKIKIITAFAIVMAMASAATAAERVKLPRQMLRAIF
jgi:hypothetical protein